MLSTAKVQHANTFRDLAPEGDSCLAIYSVIAPNREKDGTMRGNAYCAVMLEKLCTDWVIRSCQYSNIEYPANPVCVILSVSTGPVHSSTQYTVVRELALDSTVVVVPRSRN